MGNCIGNCLPTPCRFFPKNNDNTDFTDRLINNSNKDGKNKRCFFIRLFFKNNKKKTQSSKAAVLDLVDDLFSSSRENTYDKLEENSNSLEKQNIPLQCLDARALLLHTATSTPASSLDLEWEHETLPLGTTQEPCTSSWAMIQLEKNNSQSTAFDGNNTDWSRVPSADSLEWDSVQNSLRETPLPDIDTDTQALLNEIERLTEKALRETGQNLDS